MLFLNQLLIPLMNKINYNLKRIFSDMPYANSKDGRMLSIGLIFHQKSGSICIKHL